MNAFMPATRHAVKLKLGLMGPSGSGKTYSALRTAHGLCPGGKIAFLDTENGSASLYADRFAFNVLEMHAPFTVQKFLTAMDDAAKAGYDCLIIDSISAEWQDLLAEKELLDSRGGNSFTNWGSITKKHEDFKKAFVQAPIHIIACMRSKQEYVLQANDKGKQAPVKVGMGAVQREGFEYECSVVFDIDMSHHAKTSKDRTSIFGDEIFQLTEETGKTLREWLAKGGTPAPEPQPTTAPATATHATASPAAPAASGDTQPSSAHAAQSVPQGAAKVAPTNAREKARPTQAPAAPAQASPVTAPSARALAIAGEPPPAWLEAMCELAAVTVGMPENTRKALVDGFDKEGPTSLPDLLAEIAKIKSVMEPTTPGEVFSQMERPAAAEVSQEASDFVDSIDPLPADTDEPNGGISQTQYEALNAFVGAFKINRDALRSWAFKSGHLLPGANGPTLARMKAEEFAKLRTKLTNNAIAAKGETWSQRTVRIINATPITTYQPMTAAF